MNGIVVKFDAERGFGFIRVSGREEDVFVHVSNVINRRELHVGQNVRFELESSPKGPRAKNVRPGIRPTDLFLLIGLITVIVTVSLLRIASHVSWILSYLVGINLSVLILYAYDKMAAKLDYSRVPEWILHAFTFAGGTPAAVFSQYVFRHKTVKESFRFWFWVIVWIQIVLLAGLLYWMLAG